MLGSRQRKDVKALEAALQALDAARAVLVAVLAEGETPRPVLIDARTSLKEFGIGRDGLLAAAERGEIELHRGGRNRLLVDRDEIERWLRSRRIKPRQRLSNPSNDLEDWETEADRELRAVGGGK